MHTDLKRKVYWQMLLIRRFEEKLCELYPTDAIKSPIHLSIGQEAVSVAICMALQEADFISNTYRCHGTHIAKGADINQMMTELFGKNSSIGKGKAGSMHLCDITKGILPASAVVGTTIPVSTGYALSNKMLKNNKVIACMFGDGATEEGCFTESVNFAGLHSLPIVYICENNQLAIHTPIHKRWSARNICKRVQTYGLKTYHIDSGDVFEMITQCKEAVEHARNNGPVFMEIMTHRYLEHVGPCCDAEHPYRDTEYEKTWRSKDQITKLETELPRGDVDTIKSQVDKDIEAAVQFANNMPYAGREELLTDVY